MLGSTSKPARARSQALGATQLTARIEAEAAATTLVAVIDTERPNVFRRDGELWVLRFEGREVRLPDAKGLRDVSLLVAAPGREIAALDLAGAPAGGDAGPVLDRAARDAYRRRLQDLEEELDDAGAMGDLGRTERLAAVHRRAGRTADDRLRAWGTRPASRFPGGTGAGRRSPPGSGT